MGGFVMAEIISYLFNTSLNHGKFPSFLQNAKVIPCHKGDSEFGFQGCMSTKYAVNAQLNNIVNTLEEKKFGVCILLDFAKAFDSQPRYST